MQLDQPWVYIVLVGLLIVVYAKIIPRKSEGAAKPDGAIVKEMEQAMDHLAMELEEQNKALIELFSGTKQTYEEHAAKLTSRVETLEKQCQELRHELGRLTFSEEQRRLSRQADVSKPGEALEASAGAAVSPAYSESAAPAAQPEAANKAAMNMKERYSELFGLYESGKSTDYIAKKLGMNKGEISLILQLAKQEERSNA
ncbi:hypothetical protein NLX71_05760 [Paenibacillus sp. MZ04-78.2]|uniref:hypothetical protein n=1 Tax=Paenibacillus sp. MZ04-78.2 TaxID=2962034 RepID=UPI0020B65F33|nr:hypothetical protein [Paenibacillus sp. MZ04-78.2]MCP3772827.1 hypothetical protein [Paenibacillus sp. MZ04-78.2]